ncbi:MAG: glycosyltransferase family 2 protein [Patescibacteria group bacterium]|nr:glycosyltransferase family 2 protein [Patescibacteria group bacterium]
MTNKSHKLTIVISNYYKASRVVENVRNLCLQKTSFKFNIFVIDVSCDEKQHAILLKEIGNQINLELVISEKNLGYAQSHNKIKGKEKGDYILIVNPDILLKEKDTIQKMVDFMEKNENVAIVGPKQINDTGEVAMSVRAFPKFYVQVARRTFLRNLPFLKKKVAYDEMQHLDYDKTQDVDWLQSSCVMICRKFWDDVGGFNERYFLFMADIEMSARAWEMGHQVVYYPDTKVYADGKRLSAGGIGQFFENKFVRRHVIDSIKYRAKWIFKGNPRKKFYKKYKQWTHS